MDFTARWILRSAVFLGAAAPLIGGLLPDSGRPAGLAFFADAPAFQDFPGVGLPGWGAAWLLVFLASIPDIRERDDLSLLTLIGFAIWSAFSLAGLVTFRAPGAFIVSGMAGMLISAVLPWMLKDLEAAAGWARFAWGIMLLVLAASEIDVVRPSRTPVSMGVLAAAGFGIVVAEALARRTPRAGLPDAFARPAVKPGRSPGPP